MSGVSTRPPAIEASLERGYRSAMLSSLKRRMKGPFRRMRAGDEGGAMVEMAIMMPVVCLIMTGIFSISFVVYQKMELAQAVGQGGRFLAVDRGDTNPCASTASVIYAAAPSLTQSKLSISFVLDGTSYSSPTCSGTTSMIAGGSASVTATYPCSWAVYGLKLGSCSLTETIGEVVQ